MTDSTKKPSSPSSSHKGMVRRVGIMLLVGVIGLGYQSTQPPPCNICGTPNGPPVTSSRIKLNDGRHLAYIEIGVPKQEAKHTILFIHGFDSCRYDALPVSQGVLEELGIHMVSYDRPGYGESDPHPTRIEKSIALDIEQLADSLELGPKFYVIGFSMGGEAVWSCLKHIPHRLAGAALLGPVANYWWSGFPRNVSQIAWDQQLAQDKWAVRVAHHAPWLVYWWNTQKWFPCSSVITHDIRLFSPPDLEVLPKFAGPVRAAYMAQILQQGSYESLHRDMIVGFGSWDYSPLDLDNPFRNNEGSVHLWHGTQDLIVPVTMSRYIAQNKPWIRYHELPTAGHMFPLADRMGDVIVKSLILGD